MHLIAALYKFTAVADPEGLRDWAAARAAEARLTGTLLVAPEGVNGTLAGASGALRGFIASLSARPEIGPIAHKESVSAEPPFRRLKVRLKREIVSMGAPGVVSPETVGTYVDAAAWNRLLDDPTVAVVDTRNDYEVAIGRFEGAIDPKTATFRDFPAWADQAPELRRADAVAMYCTGGIRCEKATAYLRSAGVAEVFHLDGGILRYLETAPAADNRWRGHCFVFDERVSVDADLAPGPHALCRGCRRPIAPEDFSHPDTAPGVCCPACAPTLAPERRARLEERERQIQLARARGETHLARDYSDVGPEGSEAAGSDGAASDSGGVR